MKNFLFRKSAFLLIFFLSFFVYSQDFNLNNILAGKYNPAKTKDIEKVPPLYGITNSLYLNKEALEAFIELAKSAKEEGFHVFIISAIRTFYAQKSIWEGKFNGLRLVEGVNLKEKYPDHLQRALKILEYSSMPGTSRHHWGTDIDIGFNIKKAGKMLTNGIYSSGEGKRFYEWMEKNAMKFGFCQPYKNSPEDRGNDLKYGYQEEKWHWSYQPLASQYLKKYKENAESFLPNGFDGSDASGDLYMDYVLNIDSSCK